MSNRGAIVSFLRSKGLSDVAIAGILGNLKVESGFNPKAYNGNEGAIGIVQWEGGRRTNLQAFARRHGGREDDLGIQLQFMWHELTNSYGGVLQQLKGASNAAQAATIWDAHYEISAGTTRQARISAAQGYASQKLKGSGDIPAGSGGGGSPPSRDDYAGVNSLGKLLDTVPELKKLVDKAVQGDWSASKFQNAIEDSKWWKTHSGTARSVLLQKANDPASFSRSLQNVRNTLSSMTSRLGFSLTASQMNAIANTALLTGNDSNQDWLTRQISSRNDYGKLSSLSELHGQMAQTAQQLRELGYSYGHKWDTSLIARYAQNVVEGSASMEEYKQRLERWAVSAFPAVADQIRSGQTITEIASPYIDSMSRLLEVNPESLDVFDPTVRKALQGLPEGKKGVLTQTPLWKFEDQVRGDTRWAYTNNAHQQMASLASQLGQAFGFNG